MRRNPLFRALRQDKLFYQRHGNNAAPDPARRSWTDIPALRMIRMSADEIRGRAECLAARIPGAAVQPGESVIGGGSTPELTLPTWLIAVDADEKKLRANDPPIVARMENDKLLIDLRTVLPEEEASSAFRLFPDRFLRPC